MKGEGNEMYTILTKEKKAEIRRINIDQYFYLRFIMDYERRKPMIQINMDFENTNGIDGVCRSLSLEELKKIIKLAEKEFVKRGLMKK